MGGVGEIIDGGAPPLGEGLAQRFARAERRKRIRALLLTAPLCLCILVGFIYPVGLMFMRSIDNSLVGELLPETTPLLEQWDGEGLPPDEVFAAMVVDIRAGAEAKTINKIGNRMNYEMSGMSSLFRKTARRVRRADPGADARMFLEGVDKRWLQPELWVVLKEFSGEWTDSYYYKSFDYGYSAETRDYEALPESKRIYIDLFWRTIAISLTITVLTMLLGYPVAFLLATLRPAVANVLMLLVLLPFWTSLLVRTTSWIVLLQEQGVINELLIWLGAIDTDGRLQMIHNRTGTIIAMTHILLPFMILPLYSVMKTIPPSLMRAARSMGALPAVAFWRVYFPLTIPGLGAGAILVFILAIGYYITPDLVGGTTGTFISNRIAYHISSSLNWGLAAALAFILLVLVIALYWCYDRVVGGDKVGAL